MFWEYIRKEYVSLLIVVLILLIGLVRYFLRTLGPPPGFKPRLMVDILLKRTEHISHIHHIVQHHRIGHQVPILDPLFLLYRIAAAQHRPPKCNPVGKVVVGFNLRGLRTNLLSHDSIGHIVKQKERSLHRLSLRIGEISGARAFTLYHTATCEGSQKMND